MEQVVSGKLSEVGFVVCVVRFYVTDCIFSQGNILIFFSFLKPNLQFGDIIIKNTCVVLVLNSS